MEPLVVFIHAATLSRCQERIDQYLSLMKKSGLLDAIKEIFIDCVGEGDLPTVESYKRYPITVQRIHTNLEENEAPTHKHMWDYAKQHTDHFILYLHTKGVGKEINPAIEDWVTYMTYFMIEKWKICTNVLLSNKTVGVDLRPEFHFHYSGNFWWSRADWMALLPDPLEFRDLSKYPNALNSVRHAQEFWICHDRFILGHVNLWSSYIHVAQRHLCLYPRSNYTTDQ
jgi:hypothetical protein